MSPNERVFSRILEKYYSKLTATEKRIADYILKHPHESVTFSVTTLAKRANTSETTVVRFARTLGFKGFLELKSELLKRASRDLASAKSQIAIRPEKKHSVECIVAESEISNITETVDNLDSDQFQSAVDLISRSNTIYTLGSGMTSYLSRITSYQMTLIGKRSISLCDSSAAYVEQLALADPEKDMVFAFSFPPYSSTVLKTLAFVKERKVPVLAITDRSLSPVLQYANHYLFCSNNNVLPMNSVSGALVLLTSLLAKLALQQPKTDFCKEIVTAMDTVAPSSL